MKNRLLEVRELKKSRKPAFVAQDSWRRKEVVQGSWRRPKGIHSKMRLHHGGNPKLPSQGYRSPKAVRNFHPTGLKCLVVSSLKQLETVNDEGVIIASSVGMKKRLEILKAAVAKKLTVLNLDAGKFIKSMEAMLSEKKKAAASAKTSKEQEKTETAKKEKREESEEEKRKSERREMEKIITKRDQK